MQLIRKAFSELSAKELYEILKVRSEIFVVEQECIYQDLDGIDYDSIHYYYQDESGEVPAYLRVFPRKQERNVLQMGRVLTRTHGTGMGGRLLHEVLQDIDTTTAYREIFLEAQTYAVGFYKREGFAITSDEFLEDGIPHVAMRRKVE